MDFIIMETSWARDRERLGEVREAVFMREQGVPAELEWDEFDADAIHLLAKDGQGKAIGTTRLLPDGHLGRMAVVKEWRGRGVGSALLARAIEIAKRQGLRALVLNAQTQAVDFYARYGFTAEGEEFLDAGIPHLRMRRLLEQGILGHELPPP